MEWNESEYSQRTAIRLARAGAMVRIIIAADACDVCRAMASRIHIPSEVPRLPIRGCLNAHCRCRFEAVDPETKLAVSQLVAQGSQALKAGHPDQARQILRRAVSLDEMYEQGWLWLSAVVGDREKITCLEKVIEINPQNHRARQGIEILQKKLGPPEPPPVLSSEPDSAPVAESEPAPLEPDREAPSADPAAVQEPKATPPEPAPEPTAKPAADEAVAEPEPLPPELELVRAERRVIAEQWTEFIAIAIDLDAQMLLMQGQAFLEKLSSLNTQASEMLSDQSASPKATLGELHIQWQESETVGEALANVLDTHRKRDNSAPNWQSMQSALRELAHQLLDHRSSLRNQITAVEQEIPG